MSRRVRAMLVSALLLWAGYLTIAAQSGGESMRVVDGTLIPPPPRP
jgi:hypothetical protein